MRICNTHTRAHMLACRLRARVRDRPSAPAVQHATVQNATVQNAAVRARAPKPNGRCGKGKGATKRGLFRQRRNCEKAAFRT